MNTFTEKGYTEGAQGDGRVDEPRSVRADRAGHRRWPQEERSRSPHDPRRRAVSAGGRAARGTRGRCGVRRSGGREAARRRTAAADRRRRVQPDQSVVCRPQSRTARRRDLRVRHHHRRQERLRPGEWSGRRIRDAGRVHPAGAPRQPGARHRAAHRQPRRIGDRLGRHLARADDHQERARRSAARRVDVGSGGVRRLLHRDAGAGDRRTARHADRLDRDLRRQVRHRRRLREAGRADRVDQHRP